MNQNVNSTSYGAPMARARNQNRKLITAIEKANNRSRNFPTVSLCTMRPARISPHNCRRLESNQTNPKN